MCVFRCCGFDIVSFPVSFFDRFFFSFLFSEFQLSTQKREKDIHIYTQRERERETDRENLETIFLSLVTVIAICVFRTFVFELKNRFVRAEAF